MNKSYRDQTQFSPVKKTLKKGNGFSAVCIFAICYLTDKQKRKQYGSSWSPKNTVLQYLRDIDYNDNNNINYKNYLYRGLCIPCGKMTHMENLGQSQNHF